MTHIPPPPQLEVALGSMHEASEPSSIAASQSSLIPLQVSVPEGLTLIIVSSQSVLSLTQPNGEVPGQYTSMRVGSPYVSMSPSR